MSECVNPGQSQLSSLFAFLSPSIIILSSFIHDSLPFPIDFHHVLISIYRYLSFTVRFLFLQVFMILLILVFIYYLLWIIPFLFLQVFIILIILITIYHYLLCIILFPSSFVFLFPSIFPYHSLFFFLFSRFSYFYFHLSLLIVYYYLFLFAFFRFHHSFYSNSH